MYESESDFFDMLHSTLIYEQSPLTSNPLIREQGYNHGAAHLEATPIYKQLAETPQFFYGGLQTSLSSA